MLPKCNRNDIVARQSVFTALQAGKCLVPDKNPEFTSLVGLLEQMPADSGLPALSERSPAEDRSIFVEDKPAGKFYLPARPESAGFNTSLTPTAPENGRFSGSPLLAAEDRLAVENRFASSPDSQVAGKSRGSPPVSKKISTGFGAFEPGHDVACNEAGLQAMLVNNAKKPAELSFDPAIDSGRESCLDLKEHGNDLRVVPQAARELASIIPAQSFFADLPDVETTFPGNSAEITIGQENKAVKGQIHLVKAAGKAFLMNDTAGEVAGGSNRMQQDPELFEKTAQTTSSPVLEGKSGLQVERWGPERQSQRLSNQVVSLAPGGLPPGDLEKTAVIKGSGLEAGKAAPEQAAAIKTGLKEDPGCHPGRGQVNSEVKASGGQQAPDSSQGEGAGLSNASRSCLQLQAMSNVNDNHECKAAISEGKAVISETEAAVPENRTAAPESKAAVSEGKAAISVSAAAVPENRLAAPESKAAALESKVVMSESRAIFRSAQDGRPEQTAGPLQSGWRVQQDSPAAKSTNPAFTGEKLIEQAAFMAVRPPVQDGRKAEQEQLNLRPGQPGNSEVRLKMTGVAAQAGVSSDGNQAGDAVRSSHNQLREALFGYNLRLGETAVFVEQQVLKSREQLSSLSGSGLMPDKAAIGQAATTLAVLTEDLPCYPGRGRVKSGTYTSSKQQATTFDDRGEGKAAMLESKTAVPENNAVMPESRVAAAPDNKTIAAPKSELIRPESEAALPEGKTAIPENKANSLSGQVGRPEQAAGPLQSGGQVQQGSLPAGSTIPAFTGEKLVEQVTSMAVRAFMQDDRKTVRVRLQLQPGHLGKVEVRLTMAEGVVRASFYTDNEQAGNAIGSSLEQLREALQGYSLQLGESSVFVGQQGWGGREQPFLSTGNNQYLYESGSSGEQPGGLEETENYRDGKQNLINYLV